MFRDDLSVPSSRLKKSSLISLVLKTEPICYPETSVRPYRHTLRYIPEERRSELLHSVSLNSCLPLRRLTWERSEGGAISRLRYIEVALYQGGAISRGCYIKVELYRGGAISRGCYIEMALYRGGAISRGCYIEVALYRGDAISRWCYIEVALNRGGAVLRWRYIEGGVT